MSCIVLIHGREALPVRAIPYVTGWQISPDDVAFSLAQKGSGFEVLGNLRAHHLSAGRIVAEVLPKEWDGIVDRFAALTAELQAMDPDGVLLRPKWLVRSISCLPPNTFV
jgi:hypothetical protein